MEEIRDGLLAIDGSIDLTMGGTLQSGFGTDGENSEDRLSINPDQQAPHRLSAAAPLESAEPAQPFRFWRRHHAQRRTRLATNVAPQALFMMNSEFIAERSRELARKLARGGRG